MSTSFSQEKCIPCSIDTPPLEGKELRTMMDEIEGDWHLVEDKKIVRKFKFKNFAQALEFVNSVGAIAEEQGHHPDIELGWGRVKISLMTHKINGLSRNDFIMASLIDEL